MSVQTTRSWVFFGILAFLSQRHLFKKDFRKTKKSETCSFLSFLKDEKALDCEIACDYVKCAHVVLGLCKEFFARKHTATRKPTSAQPLIVTTMTHT